MDLITRERDRLLHHTARLYGACAVGVVALCLSPALAVAAPAVLPALAPLGVMLVAYLFLGRSSSAIWPVVILGAGLLTLLLIEVAAKTSAALVPSCQTALNSLTGFAIAATAFVLTSGAVRILTLAVEFAATLAVAIVLPGAGVDREQMALTIVIGWMIPVFTAIWLRSVMPKLAERIDSIGRAHRAERQASELEAQRRQSARLLHDTVLATLTLLAHSGVGVSATAMREQAAGDAQLLRDLRLGSTPMPTSSGGYNLTPVEKTELGTTLESVKDRFNRMGLEVTWHGSGQLLLPSHILDAFLLALAECLENVRRHSGVTQAHVTITEDDTTVRAMVTDQGVGFDLANVSEAKLGFAESVVARLRDVGGNARLFSAPGAGTTVVLEVPR